MKLNILAFGSHPDDVELSASGTLLLHIDKGRKVGIIDLTRGELGTRGTADTRAKEAQEAGRILGVQVRENLEMSDGFFKNDSEHQRKIIQVIRKYQPEIILCNAIADRHPDHKTAGELVSQAAFLSGLRKIETSLEGKQDCWRPKNVYHYIQDRYIKPDFVIDVSTVWEKKMQSVMAFRTQFYDPQSTEPETAISSKDFIEFLHARAMELGRPIGAKYAEGFTVERFPGIRDLFDLA